MTEQEKTASPEFIYLPLESIIVEEQIRSGIGGQVVATIQNHSPLLSLFSSLLILPWIRPKEYSLLYRRNTPTMGTMWTEL
jgi:hypothetical protein